MFSGLLKLEIRVTYRVTFHPSKKSTRTGWIAAERSAETSVANTY